MTNFQDLHRSPIPETELELAQSDGPGLRTEVQRRNVTTINRWRGALALGSFPKRIWGCPQGMLLLPAPEPQRGRETVTNFQDLHRSPIPETEL